MDKKRCKIHYRKLNRPDTTSFPEESLSSKIAEALQHQKDGVEVQSKVILRLADAPNMQGYQRFINYSHVSENFVFGDICLFSPGQMQALLSLQNDSKHSGLDETLNAWQIAESKAPPGKEYLHAIGYWMAYKDHFYMIQHVSLQTKAMEEYFTWLLREQTGAINANQYVQLNAVFDREQVGGDLGDINSIDIGGVVPETQYIPDIKLPETTSGADANVTEVESHETLGKGVAAKFDKGRKILNELFGELEAERLIKSIPDEAALEVSVNIGYRAKKRKINKEFMGNIASGLRNIPDGEIKISGRDGTHKGNDARLSTDMSIKKMSDSSGLLDMEDALKQMQEVHRRFLHDGKITA